MRLLSSNHRNVKKLTKPKKGTKPPVNCFHNTIVIAPFHTLKRCFQSKLVDLYSMEKMKKLSHNMKMAKQQNMSFEYDVVQLDKVKAKVKSEKAKKAAAEAAAKKQKEKSPSYCRCDRSSREKSTKDMYRLNEVPSFSKNEGKRRRLNTFAPNILKAELDPLILPFDSIEPFRKSQLSASRSNDSWESFSNSSPSQGRGHLEGMIAVSTTSFDSCLEQFDKESCSYLQPKKRNQRRMREDRVDIDYACRQTDQCRHLMTDGVGNSDGNILDFMDREPQTQEILMESERHLKPLKRQSKHKVRRQEVEATDYYLRSKSLSKDKLFPEISLEKRGSKNNINKKKSVQIEVATQVENSSSLEPKEQVPQDIPVEAEAEPAESDDKEESKAKDAEETVEPSIIDDSIEAIEVSLLPEEKPDAMIPSIEATEPQDHDFIFGPGRMNSRLGESCEFTFGLNWVISDDETSEHEDRFF